MTPVQGWPAVLALDTSNSSSDALVSPTLVELLSHLARRPCNTAAAWIRDWICRAPGQFSQRQMIEKFAASDLCPGLFFSFVSSQSPACGDTFCAAGCTASNASCWLSLMANKRG